MKLITKKTGRKGLALLIAVLMVLALLPVSALATSDEPAWPNPGSVKIDKTKTDTSDPGQWKIKLTVDGKNVAETSDVVLVMDCSYSMSLNLGGSSKISQARTAAKSFVDSVLTSANLTRIGVVKFSTNASNVRGLTGYSQRTQLKNSIDGLQADSNGYTNIKAGLDQARSMLSGSSADNKIIVLLSDGLPNRPYGTGSNPTEADRQAAIDAANTAKAAGCGIYAIGYDVASDPGANALLDEIQSEGYYPAGTNLQSVFQEIAGSIANAGTLAKVIDLMEDEFDYVPGSAVVSPSSTSVVHDPATDTLTWTIGNIVEGTTYTLEYLIQFTPDITLSPGDYPTNKDNTRLEYKNAGGGSVTKYFPIPKVTVAAQKYTVHHYLWNGGPTTTQVSGSETKDTVRGARLTSANQQKSIPGYTYNSSTPTILTVGQNNSQNVIKVYYTQDQYTVKYQPGTQGTFTEQSTSGLHYNDNTPSFSGTPTGNPGWSFTGWSPTVAGKVTGNATYVAQWSRDEYTVKYQPGTQGTFTEQSTSGLHYNDNTPSFSGTPTGNPGWSFTGWSPTVAGKVTGNATYVAQWTQIPYTVTYLPGDHGTFAEQSTPGLHYNDGTPAFVGEKTAQPGWAFTGWSPAVADKVTGNATYVAQWAQIPYTVTYMPGDHGTFTPQSTLELHYNDNTPAFVGEKTGDPGWTFTGWSPAVADKVTGNAVYVAQWTQNEYTVKYQPGTQGTFAEQSTGSLHYGDATPDFNGTPTGNPGWTFSGWAPQVANTVTGDATYIAQWTQDEYTVKYQPGTQGTFTEQVTNELHYGVDTPDFNGTPTGNPGWTFSGWAPEVAETVTGDATYIAQWTQDEYTVTYKPGTQGTFTEQVTNELHYGVDTPDFNGTPTGNPGWTFSGWAPEVAETVTGDATYIAQWTQDEYTVTYKPGTQGTFAEQSMGSLHYGDATPAFSGEKTAQPGWAFTGWSPAVADKVTGDATYIAQWAQIPYTVTYMPGDHGTFAPQSTLELHYNDNTPAFTGEKTGDPGWTFTGWSPAVADKVTGNATYIAQWSQNEYTVKYQPGTQGTFAEQSTPGLHYGDATPAFDGTPTGNPGWEFTGWSPEVASTVTGDATYVAQWVQIPYTVKYQPGTQGTFAEQSTGALHYGDDTPAFSGEKTAQPGWAFTGWSPAVADKVTGDATYIAQWAQIPYTVTYMPGDHGTFTPQSTLELHYNDNTPAFTGEKTGDPGWTFTGWSPAVADKVTGNATYIAQWSQNEYTVKYQPGTQGTFAEQSTSGLHYNDSTPAFDGTPTGNLGWEFTGWSPEVASTVTGDATYVAQWVQIPYTVKYQPGTQGTFAEQSTGALHYGDDTPAFSGEKTAQPGWAFTGWSPAVADKVTGDATYIAQWAQIPYTVTYMPGDHGTFTPQSTLELHYNDNTPAFTGEKTGDPGWTFTGWSPAVADKVTGDATYVAQWSQNEYTVKYQPGTQGTFAEQSTSGLHYNDSTPAFDGTPTGNLGWEFTGWSPEVASTVTGDATYVAQWVQIPYTVKYQPGTQGTFAEQSTPGLHYGDATPDFDGTPTGNLGWEFTGWSPEVASTVTGDATYVAQWVQIPYTVKYQPGTQGTFTEQSTPGLHYNDSTPAFDGTPTGNLGWTFTGWSPAVADKVTGDATYVAQWSQNEYTVKYQPGTQGTFAEQSTGALHYGDDTPAFSGEKTAQPGWAFTGWSPAVADKVTGDATYIAQWAQIPYTVTYMPGDHGTFTPQSTLELHYNDSTPIFVGEKTGDPGWTFTGWSPAVADKVTGNATYVAQWVQIPYTVKYQPGTQGTFTEQSTPGLHYGDATPDFDGTPTGNLGWTFSGWAPQVAETVTGDAIYVAQWTQDEYTVKYQPGDQGTFTEQVTNELHYGVETPDFDGTPTGNLGWTFSGWAPQVTETVTGNATYIAQWTQDEYTVTYAPGEHGAFEEQKTEGLHYGDNTPGFNGEQTGNDGWLFTGWSPEVAETVTGDVIYEAQWEEIVIVPTPTVPLGPVVTPTPGGTQTPAPTLTPEPTVQVPEESVPAGALPVTGEQSQDWMFLAGALVLAAGAILLVFRKRKPGVK